MVAIDASASTPSAGPASIASARRRGSVVTSATATAAVVASTATPWMGSATANDGGETGKLRANPSGADGALSPALANGHGGEAPR